MRLIGLVVVLALSLTLPTLAAEAQETANKAHVGVLLLTPRAGAGGAYIEALRGGLRELGYVEGQNLLLEIRSAEGRPDRLPRLAAEILGTRPDVLVTAGSEAILTLKRATDVVPIVSGSKGECGFLCKRWLTQGSTVDRVILTTEFGLDPLLRC